MRFEFLFLDPEPKSAQGWGLLPYPTFSTLLPNAATVSTVSDVGLGRMVESSLVLRLMVADLGVTF